MEEYKTAGGSFNEERMKEEFDGKSRICRMVEKIIIEFNSLIGLPGSDDQRYSRIDWPSSQHFQQKTVTFFQRA